MSLATMVSNTAPLTKEERMGIEQELVHDLLYYKSKVGRRGIDFMHIDRRQYWRIGIWNPWDLFEFCDDRDIWLKIRKFSDGYLYYGVKLRKVTITVTE